MLMNESSLRNCISELSEIAEQVGFGTSTWYDFNKMVGRIFPGSAPNLYALDSKTLDTLFVSSDGSLENLEAEYVAHYAPLNPWNALWDDARLGEARFSSVSFSSQTFTNTEFYND